MLKGALEARRKVGLKMNLPAASLNGLVAVSYTHLDVYKRQVPNGAGTEPEAACWLLGLIISG